MSEFVEVPNSEGESPEEQLSMPRRLVRYLTKEAWKDILIVGGMVYFTLNFIGFRAVIPSGSMLPTLQIDHSYAVSIISTFFSENKGLVHGDVVVFTHEQQMGNDDLMVKRVIGLPGDVVELSAGVLYRNGEEIPESYIQFQDSSISMEEFTVPDNHIFVLGDNRSSSYDGRYWEYPYISLEDVVGEMIVFGS